MNRFFALPALAAACWLLPSGASAQTAAPHATTPSTTPGERYAANPVHVGLFAGAGFALGGNGPYGGGFGARVGYAASYGLYTGIAFTTHFGTRSGVAGTVTDGSHCPRALDCATFSDQFALEVGWAIHAGPLRLQPYVGVGLLGFGVPPLLDVSDIQMGQAMHPPMAPAPRSAFSDSGFFFAPGVQVLVPLPLLNLFAGLDVRAVMVPAEKTSTWNIGAFATVGYSFGG